MSLLAGFSNRLRAITNSAGGPAAMLFNRNRTVVVARAPGRLDVMGGIADYSGSLVLQLPIREATWAAAQLVPDRTDVRVLSLSNDPTTPARTFAIERSDLVSLVEPGFASARACFQRSPDSHWAGYVVGVILVLMERLGLHLDGGLDILIDSEVPEGKGVSSSAALEVAAMRAVAAAGGVRLGGEELAILCQIVENYVVGAPCGIMDQMTSSLGREGELLALLCQPALVQGHRDIPTEITFWGIDSGIRHAVSGNDYTSVRTGAFMGYRILADRMGLEFHNSKPGEPLSIVDPRYHGYLANLDVSEFDRDWLEQLPETLRGEAFLARYQGTTDPVTRVDPSVTYPIRIPTRHPVHENARVQRFGRLLSQPVSEESLTEMGRLMYESHASYSACGLGSEGTDLIVDLVREAGPSSGLYGAKITGGGSGGTVAALGRAGADEAVMRIVARYSEITGRKPSCFSGSSPGADIFGVHEVSLT
ncbi:MAG: galactokinase family protein [Isosphaeraceae bacterium]